MPKLSKAAQSRANNLLRGREALQIQQNSAEPIQDRQPQQYSTSLFPAWCLPRPAPCDNPDDLQASDNDSKTSLFDSEDDASFEWLDDESVTEIDSEEEQSDPRDITNEAQLLTFIQTLRQAQEAAQLAAKEQHHTSRKRGHYSKNSERTKSLYRKKRREWKAGGGRLITDFFKTSTEKPATTLEEASESEDDPQSDTEEQYSDWEDIPMLNADMQPEIGFVDGSVPSAAVINADIVDISPEDQTKHLVANIRRGLVLTEEQVPDDPAELKIAHWKDFSRLGEARARLTLLEKQRNIDPFYRARLSGMLGTLNLYLDPALSFSWRFSSLLAAKAQNRGEARARKFRFWLHQYLNTDFQQLPFHHYGRVRVTLLQDEDFSENIQLFLLEKAKDGYIRAQDLVDYFEESAVQEKLGSLRQTKKTISLRTAQRWMHRFKWRYGRKQRGMYIDGHERPDVVAYRSEFVRRWEKYELRMVLFNDTGKIASTPKGFPVPQGPLRFCLILVTHDESTFFANDRRKTIWQHADATVPEAKGEGQSLMVSDFLSPEWGRLVHEEKDEEGNVLYKDEARVLFRAGKGRDGYFSSEDLLEQVAKAIDIFEEKTRFSATGLFMFDNAPSHQKRAADALSARKMVKYPCPDWPSKGVRMRNGVNPLTGQPQPFYFPDDHPTMPGWFKGMVHIIKERGLWPSSMDLKAQCGRTFGACPPGFTTCCCRRILFSQPDFSSQKSALEEYIKSRGHLCDFYPKYHCELNFIEQYWGAAKFRYRVTKKTHSIDEMEANVISCLDDVPLDQIKRYANRSARFIHAYREGLSGAEASWANRRYHGHRTLPPFWVEQARNAFKKE